MKCFRLLFVISLLLCIVTNTEAGALKTIGGYGINTDLIPRKVIQSDDTLYISAEKVAKEQKQYSDLIIVDIRSAREFTDVHIPGSLNIPPHFIKTKSFLADKTIVLADTGNNTKSVEDTCNALLKAELNVFILDGGIMGLMKNDSVIKIQSIRDLDLSLISPEKFYSEKNYEHYIIADISDIRSDTSIGLIPYGIDSPIK